MLRGVFTFYITGVIYLPYAEIKEPLEAWFDLTAKSSRIDYYHGKNQPRGKRTDSAFSLLRRICDVELRACCCKKKYVTINHLLQNKVKKETMITN